MVKHKVFISYYHKDDNIYREKFEDLFGDLFINKSVNLGDINENLSTDYIKRIIREDYISDSSVVLVLIGPNTYCRKHVDWEIYAGLYENAGLAGLILPNYKGYNSNKYNSNDIPSRLNDNLESKYASIHKWTTERNSMQKIIDDVFENKDNNLKNNSRKQFVNNRCE
jgi:hypothetical protein